jgi:DNA-binding ferritin-like protein
VKTAAERITESGPEALRALQEAEAAKARVPELADQVHAVLDKLRALIQDVDRGTHGY